MSAEFRAIRKKRTSSDATSNPAPDGDHRKRRRNRTTQSCLNCHTSKRMCDRKRPCGRCTQLGLTGLCVYEVDDPSQRTDAQDESSRLRQRVAELEGVVRELKNKPHPRWAKSGSSPGEEFEKCHARSRSRSRSASEEPAREPRHQSDPPQPPLTANSSVESNEASSEKQSPVPINELVQPDFFPPSFSPSPTGNSAISTLACSPYFDMHSPASDPSTGLVTPTDEHPQLQIGVAGNHHQLNSDIDLASFFMSYPDLLACGDDRTLRTAPHSQHADPRLVKFNHGQFLEGHCGCLNEPMSYNVMLELSLRLRRAADILSHCTSHRYATGCPLNQRITELDAFTTTVLGNIATSPNDFGPAHLRSRANTAPSGAIPPIFSANHCMTSIHTPAISPSSLRPGPRTWTGIACAPTDTSPSGDESFMTWEPSRRG